MAATGGGKIRSRRYHVASTPYAKSKQPSGLISRVTDTVKSIVPSWLQNYFKNREAPEGEAGGGGGGGGDGEGEAADVTENCLLPPPNGGREGPPSLDGCHSPEPSTSNTEPSTSRASLNFQEYVLSRPPLSHSHLHFSPLESSSQTLASSDYLFSQPSTSSAPGPITTGFSLVKENKDNLSQHEDDNISTTSGFSSRASDKDVPTAKTASLPQLWSPDMDRTVSVPQPSQSSLKRPAFNLSVFGPSANSTLNSTGLNSSQLGDSPFYPGKTTYGGAAGVRSARTRPGTPYQAPLRRQIKAKPAGAQPCGVTSATARRILQSLERMSSPLADAKRIPATVSSPLSMSRDGSDLDVSYFQPKKKRLDSNLPPVQKLVVPATISASVHRAVSFRPSLTPGGPTRTPRDKPVRQSPLLPDRSSVDPSQSTIGSAGDTYPISSTPAARSSGGGKKKRERKTTRPSSKRTEDDEVAELPDLPAISLPISTSALPTFSFSTPLPPVANSSTSSITITPIKEAVTNKVTPSSPPCVPFTFSSPIVKVTPGSPPNFSPTAGFTFSAPVTKVGPSMSNGKLATPISAPVKASTNASTENFDGPFKPAKTLKQGSVLDLLKTPGFASTTVQKSTETSIQSTVQTSTTSTIASTTSSSTGLSDLFKAPAGWSCDVCLVQNKPSDSKCVCCMAPQPGAATNDNKTTAPPFMEPKSITNSTAVSSSFSKSMTTWECDTCLVYNKPEAVKCVACETAKPGAGLKASSSLPSAFSAVKNPASPAAASPTTPFAGFRDKFKKPEGESDSVQNNTADTNLKPGASPIAVSTPSFGFGDKFKKPENSWDCDTCLLQNKAADIKCVACQAPKPGTQAQGSSSTSTSGSITFGTSNSTLQSAPGAFKFGVAALESASSSSGGFKFGIPFGNPSTETPSKDTNNSPGFKFSTSSEGFKFGITPGDDKKTEQPAAGAGFKFGSSGGSLGAGSSSTDSSSSSKTSFSFGLSKPQEKTADIATTSSSFAVTTPASSSENSSGSSVLTAATASSAFGTPTLSSSAPPGGPNFGSLSVDKKPAAPTFDFGKPEEEKKESSTTSAPSPFLFGGTSKEADPAPAVSVGFSFGKPSASADQQQPPPTGFAFGNTADKSDASISKAANSTFVFGQSAAASDAPKMPFFFMGSNATTTSGTSSTSSTSLFGSGSSQPLPPAPAPAPTTTPSTFLFGQAAAPAGSDAPPAKAFVFGQSQDTPSSAPVNSAPPQPTQPFIFGAAAAAASPAPPSINFGASAPSATPSAASNPFLVSSSNANQAPAFGSSFSSPFPSPASQTPAFGAKPAAAPAFGQRANSTPTFGAAANSTQGGGFQFGGANAFGSTNSTGVFNFGAGAAAPPASSAPSSGGFNFTQPLAFNIGSSKSFTSSPAGQPTIAGRKIKMAVRRRK